MAHAQHFMQEVAVQDHGLTSSLLTGCYDCKALTCAHVLQPQTHVNGACSPGQ